MLNLYTETAFHVNAPTPGSLLEFQIPRKNGSYNKPPQTRLQRDDEARRHCRSEQTFVKEYLASQSSIYFRQAKTYPRTFLWRVVSDDRVLQVQCADVARSETNLKEAYLTLSFAFQDQIIPRGVAWADLDSRDELHVFVCTSRNEIFHLRLPTSAFGDRDALGQDVPRWCKPLDISSLTIDVAHHIYASTPQEFFISFVSGRIQRLTRRSKDEHWTQENYDDKTWGASLRGIVGRRGLHTIEYGSSQLDSRTVQAMVATPDGHHLFTICLNHTLRVWHLPSGKLVSTKDLLDAPRDPDDRTQLNPAEDALLQCFTLPLHRHPLLLSYSPHEGGQFKFWDVRGGLTEPLVVEDKYPGVTLSPPDPDPTGNTVWSLTGFKLRPGDDFRPAQLWALWRNNNYHQLYTIQFEFNNIASAWKSGWVMCAPTSSSRSLPPDLVKGDSEDPTSKWLDFLFFPGRYPAAVLETALSIFEDATSAPLPSSQKATSLRQRMCTVVAANASLRKYEDSDMDYDRFIADTDHQWRNMYRIAENVNDARQAPLALAYDGFSEMAWITMAGKCCAIRECSMVELIQHNKADDLGDLEETTARLWPHRKVSAKGETAFPNMSILVSAARTFCESFSAELSRDLLLAIEDEIYTDLDYLGQDRVAELFDQVNFHNAVSNDSFYRLEKDLGPLGGWPGLDNDVFLALLDTLVNNTKRAKSSLRTTIFASELFAMGMRDCISSTRQLLLDMLALIIFVEGEEDAHTANLDAAELFFQIVQILKLYDRNLWLATHSRLVPIEVLGPDSRPNVTREKDAVSAENGRVVTILEDALSKAVRPQPAVEKPLLYLITDQLAEIQDWAAGKDAIDPDDGAVYLQCDLITQGDVELAADFLRFQPSTSWSMYVKARLFLAKEEYDIAVQYFRKAAYGLACGKAMGDLTELSAGLLSILDVECFNNGLPRYLQHISTLFEAHQAYAHAAHFARLILQALVPGHKDPLPNFRTDVLSRLFTAELKQLRFDEAYDALVQLPDQALQRSLVVALVNAVLNSKTSFPGSQSAVEILQRLPWTMHPHLARHLDHHLSSLAKKQTTVAVVATDGSGGTDYLAMVHAMRVANGDYRGAVAVLFDRLRLVQRNGRARQDPQATALRQVLLSLINVMACVKPEEAYVIVDAEEQRQRDRPRDHLNHDDSKGDEGDTGRGVGGGGIQRRKRRRIIVTLDDLRKEYANVLDRCARIERGDFDFDLDSDGDEDSDTPGDEMEHSRLNMNVNGMLSSRRQDATAGTSRSDVAGGGDGSAMEF